MALRLNDSFVKGFVSADDITALESELKNAHEKIIKRNGEGNDFLGWIDLPVNYDKAEFAKIKECAADIAKKCDIMVVIGIGGSYLGARAAIEFVKSPLYNNLKKDTPDVYFTGNDICPSAMNELLAICEGRDICVNVISKSGTTTEPAIAFRVFRQLLEKKYGTDEAKNRIYVTTDKAKGKLKELSDEKGYQTFVVPDDVGGRYSVLTAVGLLPIAVAGIDIDEMMAGAQASRDAYLSEEYALNDCYKYAAIRNVLNRGGKDVEILASYDPALGKFAEWWKQLYGESEGKDGKGIFPASVTFSTDLHSLGQIIQQGKRNIFETVLTVKDGGEDLIIPDDPANVDGLNFLAGRGMSEVCDKAFIATAIAHTD
ncbi:MAG: glucose-6-phosphate isomerase, partial [Clostridia bacterium]|nr:glucose-6-phosphate isomerase [Clostridia bacterium]